MVPCRSHRCHALHCCPASAAHRVNFRSTGGVSGAARNSRWVGSVPHADATAAILVPGSGVAKANDLWVLDARVAVRSLAPKLGAGGGEFSPLVVHFARDEQEVMFYTQRKAKASWFFLFNPVWSDGAGNQPNPDGLKPDYLWKRILTPRGLKDILETTRRSSKPGTKSRCGRRQ